MAECRRCGRCCRNNGLIPPATADDPVWLQAIRRRLMPLLNAANPPIDPEESSCLFLAEAGGQESCLIYEQRPAVCREFDPEDCPGNCGPNEEGGK